MTYELWNHQQTVYDKVMALIDKGSRAICIQMPTRSGKSGVASKLIEHFSVDLKESVFFTGHTKILINQMSQELTDHGIKHGIIAPGYPEIRYRVQVTSKDSLFIRIKRMKASGWKAPLIIIVDECHLAMGNRYKELLDEFPETVIIGLTATPVRLDRKALNSIFTDLVIGPSIKELQSIGRLAMIDTLAVELFDDTGIKKVGGDFNKRQVLEKVDNKFVISEIVRHWKEHAEGLKTLTFAVSIDHAHDLADQFNDAGYPSIAVSSKDGAKGIKDKLAAYYAGKYINLVSVELFIMGFTVRDCRCIIQARPTDSLMIYLQTVGRGMIPNEDGSPLINLDCVNNWDRHQLPEDDREWSLEAQPRRKKNVSSLKRCPVCQRISKVTARKCEHCGFQWTEVAEAASRIPEEKEGRLVKITRSEAGDLTLEIARRAHTLKEAIKIAREQGVAHTVAFDIWVNILRNKKDEIKVF